MTRSAIKNIAAPVLIIAAGLIIRLYNIDGALFDFNPLRQALNAFVARNYAFTPGAMFLLPQVDSIDWIGSSSGYLMFELPILPYLTSFLLKAFGVHNWAFRVVPILAFAVSAGYFYKVSSLMAERRVSLLALALYLFAPMSILMSRAFQAEALMMLAMLFSVFHFFKWLEKESPWNLAAATAGLMLSVLLKITNLYIFIFLGALFFIYNKKRLIPRFAGPAVAVLFVGVWWWFVYTAEIRAMFPGYVYSEAGGNQVFGARHIAGMFLQYAFSPAYWMLTLKQCSWIVFSPPVFLLLIGGLASGWGRRSHALLIAWFLSAVFFLAAVPSAAAQDYYKLHLIPAGAILAATFFFVLYDTIASAGGPRKAFAWLMALLTALFVFAAVYPVMRYKPVFHEAELLGGRVADITQKDDLVIASFGSDEMLLFYCGRRGWDQYIPSGGNNIELLEERRKNGAKYFVSGNLKELASDPAFEKYMMKKYRLLLKENPVYGEPEGFTLEHAMWFALDRIDMPWAQSLRSRIEARSLGVAIFDLKERAADAK